jgi:hypothetical protein
MYSSRSPSVSKGGIFRVDCSALAHARASAAIHIRTKFVLNLYILSVFDFSAIQNT